VKSPFEKGDFLYEITQTRHPGVLLAGVQQFKELDSGQKPAGMTQGDSMLCCDPSGHEGYMKSPPTPFCQRGDLDLWSNPQSFT
jgi:hypothetical protein